MLDQNDQKIKISKTLSPYSIITNKVAQGLNYNLAALGLFVYIYSLPDGWEFHKNHLQKVCNVGINKLDKLLKVLSNHGLINIVQVRNAQGQFAHFSMEVEHCEKFIDIKNNELEKSVHRSMKTVPTVTVPRIITPINKTNTNKEDNKLNISCASHDARKSFEEFWSVYPRKQNKKRTQQIWIKNKLYEKSKDIISKVLIQIEHDPQWQDKQYIPQPSTYLNGARWDDEIILPNKPKQILKKIDETPNRYGSMRNYTDERLEEEANQQKGLNNANESHGSGFASNKHRGNGVRQAKDYLLP